MKEPIRILHVIGVMHRGGAETMIMNFYRNIDRTRVQFDFVENAGMKADYDEEIRAMGGRIYHCPRYKGKNHIAYVAWWKEFYAEHGSEYTAVHGHIGSTASIYLHLAKKAGLYTVAHSHNTNRLSLKDLVYQAYAYPTRHRAKRRCETPKYSVIIPIYKAEKTLRRCVDSLLTQNYSDMELILVNDGSPDGSGAICEEYRDRYSCVVYIDKPNGGVSTARNAGLDVATGEYVLFVDSDDYVSEDYFWTLDSLAAGRKDDLVMFSYIVTDGKHSQRKIAELFQSDDAEKSVPMFSRMLYTKAINQPWAKRYIRKIIEENHIRFPENLYIGEDKCFNLQYVMHCYSCQVSPKPLYYVSVENDQSLSRKIRPDLYQQFEMVNARVQQIIKEADIPEQYREQYRVAENLIQLRAVYSEAKRMHLMRKDRRTRRNVIRKMCDDLNRSGMQLPKGAFTTILKIPVRLKCVTLLDAAGKLLAK